MNNYKILCLLLFFLDALVSFAQPEIAWQSCYGTSGTDYFSDVIVTSDGGFAAVAEFGGVDGIMEGQDSLLYPATLLKFDSDLNLSWIRNYGGTTAGSGFVQLCEVNANSYVLAGVTADIDGDFSDNHGSYDLFLMKVDLDGNKLFAKCYGSPGIEEFTSFIPVTDGGYLITGKSYSIGGDIPIHYGDGMTSDVIIIKTDSVGEIEWLKVLGGSNVDGPLGDPVEIKPGAYFISIGSASNDYDLEVSGIPGGKRWINILDAEGNSTGENFINAETDIRNSDGNTIYKNNHIEIAGSGYAESIYYPTSPEHAGYEGAMIIFDTLMQVSYMKQWGGDKTDIFERTCNDAYGNYYFLGFSNSTDDDLPGNYNDGEAYDYWLTKTDNNFNLYWSKNFGGSDNCGDLDCGGFHGQIVVKDNMLYAFIKNVVPDVLPDFDIECGALGAGNTDAWLVAFDLNTDISSHEAIVNSYSLCPNPALNEVVIVPKVVSNKEIRISITNINGLQIYCSNFFENDDIKINTLAFPKGIYIVNIIKENTISTCEKLIVL